MSPLIEASSSSSSLNLEVINNKQKNEAALLEFNQNLTYYLSEFTNKAGYDVSEMENPNYQNYLLLILFNAAKKLYLLKSSMSKEIAEEEQNLLKRLDYKANLIHHEPKIVYAVELFIADLPFKLTTLMLSAGFLVSETKDNHDIYISFFSSVVFSLTEVFILFSRLKSTPKASNYQNTGKEQVAPSILSPNMKRPSEYISQIGNNSSILQGVMEEDLPPGFSSIELVAVTKKHNIYCISNASKSLALKVLKSNIPSLKDIKNLNTELEFSRIISHTVFRSSVERTMFQNKSALILEWANGFPVSLINDMQTFSVMEFLGIARDIVSSLLAMHMKHVMHLNLTCEHIIIDPQSKSIKIIGCGSSTSFTSKPICLSNHELLQRDLRCISPEQTGRANRVIDFRSDMYSLGIIFYKILTGRYPLDADSALELVYLHILQEPESVCCINKKIPVPISNMISKLMAKNIEDRYLSTKGIIYDLDLMISEYDTDNILSSVILGQHNLSEILRMPQKLYGRTTEYNTLCSVFEKIDLNSFERVFVTGNSGTGKSALVFELYKVVARKRGFFISGKFDQSKREPYSALLETLKIFCDDLLLKDKATIEKYRSIIQAAVGEEGKILTDVIYNLHLIVGEQLCIADAFGKDAKNRFNYVFIKFFKAICSVGPPIVLVLEDLQWLDNETRNLLNIILVDKSIKNLMFIGVYRSNEVNNEHPVADLLLNISNLNIAAAQIELENLDHESVNELISDALCLSYLETYALTVFIHEKTGGNPFFVIQVLKSLCEEGLIFLCMDTFKWKWDDSIFGASNISENVIELLKNKILALDEQTQQALKVASCLGSPFSLSSLKLIVNNKNVIESLLSTGMVTQCERSNTYYRFVHDQIQDAATSLLPKDPRELLFYIGKKLCVLFTSEELDENIFTVVGILCNAVDIIRNQEERTNIAELCFQAGKKAMAMTAFKQAFDYSRNAIQFLSSDCWRTHYDLSLNLYNLAAKAAYCVADYKRMNMLIEKISSNVTFTLHFLEPLSLKIRYYNERNMYDDAIRVTVDILDKMDRNIMKNQFDLITTSDIQKVKSLLNEKSSNGILMARANNETMIAIMMMLGNILCSAFFSSSKLFFFVSCSVLCGKKEACGYQFGKFGLTLLKENPRKEVIPKVYSLFYITISPFYASIHDIFHPLLDAIKVCFEIGSNAESTLTSSTYFNHAFLTGKPLKNLLKDFLEIKELLPVKTMTFSSAYQATLNLRGENSKNRNSALVCGDDFSYTSCFDINGKGYDISRVSVICIVMAYLFGDYYSALKFVESCRLHETFITSVYSYPIYLFYSGLVSLELAKHMPERMLQNAEECVMKLKSLTEHAPMNYLNKIRLLEAEMAVVVGDSVEAVAHYQEAISLSKKYGFLHEEAIAYERAVYSILNLIPW